MLRAARRARRASGRSRSRTTFLGAHALPPEVRRRPDAYIDAGRATRCCRRIARAGLADAVDAFCEGIAFTPAQIARVFDGGASARPAGEAARRAALEPRRRRAGGRAIGALSADHLEYTDEAGAAAMAAAGTVAVLLPGAFYFLRETQKPPVELFRRHGVPMAVATDCNPGTSPLTSLLLAMNMAATLFRLTVEECLAGVTREAARALGLLDRDRHAGGRQGVRPRDLGRRAPGRARLPHRLQSAASRASGGDDDRRSCCSPARRRSPTGAPSIAAPPPRSIRPARRAIEAERRGGRAASSRKGEPVYGINTGFGKLASVRIDGRRPRARCSATSCCRMPPASASRCPRRSCG